MKGNLMCEMLKKEFVEKIAKIEKEVFDFDIEDIDLNVAGHFVLHTGSVCRIYDCDGNFVYEFGDQYITPQMKEVLFCEES